MTEIILMLVAVLLPVVAGTVSGTVKMNRKSRRVFVMTSLALTAAAVTGLAFADAQTHVLLEISPALRMTFSRDGVSTLFSLVAAYAWLAVGLFSFTYMERENDAGRFYAFFLSSLGAVLGMDFAGDLITLYLFYEMITLLSFPLVLHSLRPQAIRAAFKYLFYSVAGGFLALFGIVFCYTCCETMAFVPGGTLDAALNSDGGLRVALFCAILGFGAKAGSYPLHGWLPTAHPEAPAPASALLSGVIAKAGVLAIIRIVFYVAGADFIRGTWVQTAWSCVALLTVFMGSMMAYREKILKKRLAYSTVSQISYILFGLSLLNGDGFTGAMLHVVFHAVIKCGLFLVAGAIIFKTGYTNVDDMAGIGKKMPATMWCFTLLSLALTGIPPTCGFISKWYLASGALTFGGALGIVGVAVLLISALLTAGYLLPVAVKGFFPGKGAPIPLRDDADCRMLISLISLAALAVLLGIFLPDALTSLIGNTVASLSL